MILDKINPFGKRKKVKISEESARKIFQMMTQFPEFWAAIEDAGYTQMNMYTRDMIVADKGKRDDIAVKVKTIDDFLKMFHNIKKMKYDETVEKSGHLPELKPEKVAQMKTGAKKRIDIMDYIKSSDSRDKYGNIRLTSAGK